jgi:dienelactone hydrolase
VLLHACGGWTPPPYASLHKHARYLASHGFIALNLDSFGPRGNARGAVCKDRAQSFDANIYRAQDAYDARAFLAARADVDAQSIFLMGQSHGAGVAVQIADRGSVVSVMDPDRNFRAAVAYYPSCSRYSSEKINLGIPLAVFGAALDDWTPARPCEAMISHGAEYQFVLYPGAVHGFDIELPMRKYLGYRMGYDAAATRDSRKRMVEFFRRHMATNPKPN